MSTYLSSPIQALSGPQTKQSTKPAPKLHLHGYSYDENFITGQNEDDSVETDDDDSEESFQPIREKGKLRKGTRRILGPPITTDEKIERLNSIHQFVVEGFLNTAKQQSQKVCARGDPCAVIEILI